MENYEKLQQYNELLGKSGMNIGIVADIYHIDQRTLRIYDIQGILCPHRSAKNTRYYNFEDINKLEFILFLTRNLAVNIAGIKIILTLLERLNIKPEKYKEYADEIAQLVGIDLKLQEENIQKNSKKGRKAKK